MFGKEFLQLDPLKDLEETVEQAPNDKIPAGTVPHAREKEHGDQIAVGAQRSFSVSAQGDIHIFPEPGAQGDMPPLPEFVNGTGEVGIAEILQKVEAEHFAQTDGHVGIARKIIVDLHGVGDRAHPCRDGGHVG